MSSILYYSNYCEPSKKLLQIVTKSQNAKDIHFICIDKRIKDSNGKVFIILQNEQKIIMPENVTKVPALLLLNQNYKVVYGDEIYQILKPIAKESVKVATQNNMEPSCFSFDSGGSMLGVMSDNFSFLDQGTDELGTKGSGGQRQMYNYVGINESDGTIQTPTDDYDYSKGSGGSEMTVEQLQQMREEEFKNSINKPNNIN